MSSSPLESWIRDALYDDPSDIFNCLALDPPDEYYRWTEFQTDCGRVDLVFAWREHVILVEVKRDRADEGAVTQVLRYAGAFMWANGQATHKVVAAQDFTDGARYAAFASDVELLRVVPGVRVEHADFRLPTDRKYYEELGRVVWPIAEMPQVEAISGSGESGEGRNDPASPVRRDPDSTEGENLDRMR